MAQLTADKSRKFKLSPDVHNELPVDAAITIYMGSMVSRNPATSLAHQLVAGEDFLGFAFAPAWNIADPYKPGFSINGILLGAAGAVHVELREDGVVAVPLAAVAGAVGVANLENTVYATDGDTLTLSVSNQTLTETGGPTGGTFVLTASAVAGSAIAYNATGAGVLTGLPASIASMVSGVTGPASGPWVITWNPGVTPVAITLTTNSLTGGTSPSITIGSSAAITGQSKMGTIRNYLNGEFEIAFQGLTRKVQ